MQGRLGERALGFAPDALDHGHEAIRALRRQMLGQVQLAERLVGVDAEDLFGRPSRIKRKENGDQAAHNMGITVAEESENRHVSIRLDLGREPHLANAALNLVGCRMISLGQGFEPATKLDDVTIAVFPFVEQGKIDENLVETRFAGLVQRIHGT